MIRLKISNVILSSFIIPSCAIKGRNSAVDIAIRYGLHGPGFESWWGMRYSAPLETDPRSHPASYTMGTGSFPGVKRPGRGVDHPPPSSAEVKGRVELHLPILGLRGLLWGELYFFLPFMYIFWILCSCYVTPCWWSQGWPKHFGEEYVIGHIYGCAFVGST